MKNIFFLWALLVLHLPTFGQGALTIHYTSTTGPFWYGETTSLEYDYRINGNSVNLPSLCNEAFSVLGNTGGVATKLPTGNVNVVWGSQKSTDARLNIHLTNCSSQANNGSRPSPNYSVMSITQETPAVISGTGDVAVCQSTPITYSTEGMSIPNGVNRAVDGYEWTIPIGWKFPDGQVSTGAPRLFQTLSSFSIQLTPDCKGSGQITVRAWTRAENKGTAHYIVYRVRAL